MRFSHRKVELILHSPRQIYHTRSNCLCAWLAAYFKDVGCRACHPVGGLLGLASCREDGAWIILEDTQPRGHVRRVVWARMVGDPKIVMFDEPTAGLDPPTARTICELAMKLRDLEDVSSIFVTHEMNNLDYLCSEYAVVDEAGEVVFEKEGEKLCLINSKVLMMRDGQVIFSGTDETLRKAEDKYIQKFLRGH